MIEWLQSLDSARAFFLLQIGVGVFAILFFVWLQGRRSEESAFRLREADRVRPSRKSPRPGLHASQTEDELAKARMQKARPLPLPGIRIDGPPHEILGIAPQATSEQIQRAYRELMKRYHPDKVGRPGSREWQDAQKIAEAINRAKEELLSRHRSRS